jgi:undecaprenyl-diphosphatase
MLALDVDLFYALYAGNPNPQVLALWQAVTWLGGGWALWLLAPLLLLRRLRPFAVGLGATVGVTAVATWVLKRAVGRVRPCNLLPEVVPYCPRPTDPSFPSGHAAGAFAAAVFCLVVYWMASPTERRNLQPAATATAVAVPFALGSAFSRVYLGVHFPSDILAGAVLGTLLGAAGAVAYVRLSVRWGASAVAS